MEMNHTLPKDKDNEPSLDSNNVNLQMLPNNPTSSDIEFLRSSYNNSPVNPTRVTNLGPAKIFSTNEHNKTVVRNSRKDKSSNCGHFLEMTKLDGRIDDTVHFMSDVAEIKSDDCNPQFAVDVNSSEVTSKYLQDEKNSNEVGLAIQSQKDIGYVFKKFLSKVNENMNKVNDAFLSIRDKDVDPTIKCQLSLYNKIKSIKKVFEIEWQTMVYLSGRKISVNVSEKDINTSIQLLSIYSKNKGSPKNLKPGADCISLAESKGNESNFMVCSLGSNKFGQSPEEDSNSIDILRTHHTTPLDTNEIVTDLTGCKELGIKDETIKEVIQGAYDSTASIIPEEVLIFQAEEQTKFKESRVEHIKFPNEREVAHNVDCVNQEKSFEYECTAIKIDIAPQSSQDSPNESRIIKKNILRYPREKSQSDFNDQNNMKAAPPTFVQENQQATTTISSSYFKDNLNSNQEEKKTENNNKNFLSFHDIHDVVGGSNESSNKDYHSEKSNYDKSSFNIMNCLEEVGPDNIAASYSERTKTTQIKCNIVPATNFDPRRQVSYNDINTFSDDHQTINKNVTAVKRKSFESDDNIPSTSKYKQKNEDVIGDISLEYIQNCISSPSPDKTEYQLDLEIDGRMQYPPIPYYLLEIDQHRDVDRGSVNIIKLMKSDLSDPRLLHNQSKRNKEINAPSTSTAFGKCDAFVPSSPITHSQTYLGDPRKRSVENSIVRYNKDASLNLMPSNVVSSPTPNVPDYPLYFTQTQEQSPLSVLTHYLNISSWYPRLMPFMKKKVDDTLLHLLSALHNFKRQRQLHREATFDILKIEDCGEVVKILCDLGLIVDANGNIVEDRNSNLYGVPPSTSSQQQHPGTSHQWGTEALQQHHNVSRAFATFQKSNKFDQQASISHQCSTATMQQHHDVSRTLSTFQESSKILLQLIAPVVPSSALQGSLNEDSCYVERPQPEGRYSHNYISHGNPVSKQCCSSNTDNSCSNDRPCWTNNENPQKSSSNQRYSNNSRYSKPYFDYDDPNRSSSPPLRSFSLAPRGRGRGGGEDRSGRFIKRRGGAGGSGYFSNKQSSFNASSSYNNRTVNEDNSNDYSSNYKNNTQSQPSESTPIVQRSPSPVSPCTPSGREQGSPLINSPAKQQQQNRPTSDEENWD